MISPVPSEQAPLLIKLLRVSEKLPFCISPIYSGEQLLKLLNNKKKNKEERKLVFPP